MAIKKDCNCTQCRVERSTLLKQRLETAPVATATGSGELKCTCPTARMAGGVFDTNCPYHSAKRRDDAAED